MKRLEFWRGDWRDRVLGAVTQRGYSSMSDLLRQFPGVPYNQVNKKLGTVAVPLQVLYLQIDEANTESEIRFAAMDCLCRKINEAYPEGWHTRPAECDWTSCAARFDSVQKAVGYADRISDVQVSLVQVPPPDGWLPRDTDDPILVERFAKFWPLNG